MLELSRTVRFCVNDPPDDAGADPDATRHNTFAAWPAMHGLGRYYELNVTCRGDADPATGYFINIKHVDQAVRRHALALFHDALALPTGGADAPIGTLMGDLFDAINPALQHAVARIELRLTPTYRVAIRSHDMDHVLIRQQYEFSAAHRLHVPQLSDEQNRAVFGKCNNPAGHGHNYRLEVAVRAPIRTDGRTLDPDTLDRTVNQHAVEPLDHKHLNADVPQFARLNPSVENIVRVIWDMLHGPIGRIEPGVELAELSVWETTKTVCTYHGPAGVPDAR